MRWIERRPDELRLNAAVTFCGSCSTYSVAKRLTEWVLARPECSAEMALFYLCRMGMPNFEGWTEEGLRSDPDWFRLVDGLVSGQQSGRFKWRGQFRSDGRDPVTLPVEAWNDVPSLQFCDLYEYLECEHPPPRILDAFEVLGSYSGERVSKTARKLLIKKGYDPKTLQPRA